MFYKCQDPISYPKRNLGILRGNPHVPFQSSFYLNIPFDLFTQKVQNLSPQSQYTSVPPVKMRAVQVSEYVKVPTANPQTSTPNSNPKLTHPLTGPSRPKSNNSPNPNPNSGQIPNRNPLGRHELLRYPPNPRQIPKPTTTPLDRRRRIRRHNHRRAHLPKQPLQAR